jgi:carboxyl-terminal processing protease
MNYLNLFLILSTYLLLSRPLAAEKILPTLSPQDTQQRMKELLCAHIGYKELSLPLVEKLLKAYVDYLDPFKIYFLNSEVTPWTHPSIDLTSSLQAALQRGDFMLFQEIQHQFIQAIHRRHLLEERLDHSQLQQESILQQETWPSSLDHLAQKLQAIRSLQQATISKLSSDPEKLMQQIQKSRISRESQWLEAKDLSSLAHLCFLKAFASSLDAHTAYLTPFEASHFLIQVQGKLCGIGAQLRDDFDGLTIVRLLEQGPARHSNLCRVNDKIIAVNQEPIVGMDLEEAVEMIRGPKGTLVHLTLLRDGATTLDVELTRGEIILEESRLTYYLEPFGHGHIVYLRLASFYQDETSSSALDLKKALEESHKVGPILGVLLDLRGNAGGPLQQAVAVTDLFMKNGVVVTMKNHQGTEQRLRALSPFPIWKGPLIVLVDTASASASEIVAQTLQDYGLALVVGDPQTFGKGSVQIFSLPNLENFHPSPLGEYKVTQALYYTVSGKSPQLTGVKTDISIPGLLSYLDVGEKFAKNPLDTSQIVPHFDDDLADLPPSTVFSLEPTTDIIYSPNSLSTTLTKSASKDIQTGDWKGLPSIKILSKLLIIKSSTL